MLTIEQISEMDTDNWISDSLKNIDCLNELCQPVKKFKDLDAIKLLRVLVKTAEEKNVKVIQFDDGFKFILNIRAFRSAELLSEGEEMLLKSQKLIDHVNNGLKEDRKAALGILKKLEKLGLVA